MIKFQFGGGATSIPVLDLEYEVQRPAAAVAEAEADRTTDVHDAPIVIHVTMTGAPLREHLSPTRADSIAPSVLSRQHCRRKSLLDSGDTTAMVDDEFVISDANDIQLDNLTSVGEHGQPAPASQSTVLEDSKVNIDAVVTDLPDQTENGPDQSVPPPDALVDESILCASSIVYRPLLCLHTSTIERITSSLAYRVSRALFVALLIASFVLHAFAPSVAWPFTLLLLAQHVFIFGDLGRVDRTLLSFVVRRFDFWFLFVYQIMFLALQLHGPLTNAQCGAETGWTTNPTHIVAIAYAMFWINLTTFLTDAMPLASRGFKIKSLLLTLANAIRILIFDRVPSRLCVCSGTSTWINM